MNISIEVTQNDINIGIPRRGCACPIYWAVERKLNEINYPFNEVIVSSTSIRICNGEKIRSYNLPVEGMKFVRLFDDDQFVEPFNFILELN